jgi:pimeloyl-ACP methyl ester carboxylesterase
MNNAHFRQLAGWIAGTFDGNALYPESEESSSGTVGDPVEKFELDDFECERHGGMESRAAPFTYTLEEAQQTGILLTDQILGVDDATAVRTVRPVVVWFDGTHTCSDNFQCMMNLADGVPPNLYDAEERYLEVARRVEKYNSDLAHTEKFVILTAGHSMGAIQASAIALKHRCGSLCINGLGLGRGVRENFVGKKSANNDPSSIIWLGAKGDHTSDPNVSPIYRRQPGRIFRFQNDAMAANWGHDNYRDMLRHHGIAYPPEVETAEEGALAPT